MVLQMYESVPVETLLSRWLLLALCLSSITTLNSQSPPALTIQSPDGDIIDCVYFGDQIAFDHHLWRHQKINDQIPKVLNSEPKKMQVWNINDTSCPDKTVPFLHSKGDARPSKKRTLNSDNAETVKGHEYAVGRTDYMGGIYGTYATMSLWEPSVQNGTDEYSSSQIWLVAGSYDKSDLNTIEAGWMAFPDRFHDNQPRLFVYWTRDGYQKTGCFNFDCPGFVQVSTDYALGGAFSPISSYGGDQYDLKMTIWKDPEDENWWLGIGQSFIGYWPNKLFTHLSDNPAKSVHWGGEVLNTRINGYHTTTQMGSGHFAEEGFGKASLFYNLLIMDYMYRLLPLQDMIITTVNTTCYSAVKAYTKEHGVYLYYGGPGLNSLCL